MSFTKQEFDPANGWANTTMFPTNPTGEITVRTMMQNLPDQLKDMIHDLIDELESATTGASGSEGIGSALIEGLESDGAPALTVYEQLAAIWNYAKDLEVAGVGTGGITTELLAALAVTTAKMANGSVTTEKLDNGAVTAEKIASGVLSAPLTWTKLGGANVQGTTGSITIATSDGYKEIMIVTCTTGWSMLSGGTLRHGAHILGTTIMKLASNGLMEGIDDTTFALGQAIQSAGKIFSQSNATTWSWTNQSGFSGTAASNVYFYAR